MSVFGSIVSAIFGSKHAAAVTPPIGGSAAAPSSSGSSRTFASFAGSLGAAAKMEVANTTNEKQAVLFMAEDAV